MTAGSRRTRRTPRGAVLREVRTPKYRQRVERDRTQYRRHPKHKRRLT